MALCPATAETFEKLLQYSKEDHDIEKCPCHICKNIAADRARTGPLAEAEEEETFKRTENDIESIKRLNRELYRAAHPPIFGSPFNSSEESANSSNSVNSSNSSKSSSSPNSSHSPNAEEETTSRTINGIAIHKDDRLNLAQLNKVVGELEQHSVNHAFPLAKEIYNRWKALVDARTDAFLSGWLLVDLADYGVYTTKADPVIPALLDRKHKVDADDLVLTLEHGWMKEFVGASRAGLVEASASSSASSSRTNNHSVTSRQEKRQRSNSSALSSSTDSDSAVSISSTINTLNINDTNTNDTNINDTNTNHTNTTQAKKKPLTCACHPLATLIRKEIVKALTPLNNETLTVWALQKIIDDAFAKSELFWTLHRSDRQGVYPHGFFIYQSRLREVVLRRFAGIPPLLRGEENGRAGVGQRRGGGGRNGHVRVNGHRRGVGRGRRVA
ncbi:hypothetical protein BDY17DRAFT_326916 [Neohortaea acidophila]|uniref:Uncharacterized protein n=1 Tax=Neohortaea acidophila TaxID=245834 RepID=A0A6A6PK82_9PEZI|nr:uncharacterized protein BDY17DRAFT_326916 [Neohortaea acidophila]KAF2479913.1 hypothetical protein BDY17DRAFT_326916 [Neohortaea acidophila]